MQLAGRFRPTAEIEPRPSQPLPRVLAGVRRASRLLTLIIAAALLGLSGPAVVLASGGGSAGDQQYTDPFAGSPTTPKSTPTTKSTPVPTTTPTPAATGTAPPPTSSATPATTVAATSATSTPQTVASTSQLPYTGYDGWLAAGCGLVLLGAGLVLRRHSRST